MNIFKKREPPVAQRVEQVPEQMPVVGIETVQPQAQVQAPTPRPLINDPFPEVDAELNQTVQSIDSEISELETDSAEPQQEENLDEEGSRLMQQMEEQKAKITAYNEKKAQEKREALVRAREQQRQQNPQQGQMQGSVNAILNNLTQRVTLLESIIFRITQGQ